MPRKLAASDRKSLIRLASTMEKGSPERRAILAGLKVASPDPVAGWVRKNKRSLADAAPLLQVGLSKREKGAWEVTYDAGQQYYKLVAKYEDQTDEYYAYDVYGAIRGGPGQEEVIEAKKFLRFLDRLLKAALKAKGDETVRVKVKKVDFGYGMERDPDGGWEVYVGPKKIGEVWKGRDKKYHSSLYGAGYGYRFRSRKDAIADLIEGGYKGTAKSRGQRNPTFE